MVKVKTFTSPLKIFHAQEEFETLDGKINQFIKESNVQRVISVSDTCTCDDTGATIGIVRVVAYE